MSALTQRERYAHALICHSGLCRKCAGIGKELARKLAASTSEARPTPINPLDAIKGAIIALDTANYDLAVAHAQEILNRALDAPPCDSDEVAG